uniref:Uncharacterized protein n=1 Tax=Cucumis melo TaxID=3656 RepID=A0A9I9DII6_CUCME
MIFLGFLSVETRPEDQDGLFFCVGSQNLFPPYRRLFPVHLPVQEGNSIVGIWEVHRDCCDGSDEYEGNIFCPNTCVMGGNMYKSNNDVSTTRDVDIVIRKVKEEITKEDLFQKLTGLKLVIILQVALTIFAILIWANRCRVKSKRRRHR